MNDQNNEQNSSIADAAFVVSPNNPTRIQLIRTTEFEAWQQTLTENQQNWLARQIFEAKSEQTAWLEDDAGAFVAVGWNGKNDFGALGRLPLTLPEGDYVMSHDVSDQQLIGWGLGSYQFTRYKAAKQNVLKSKSARPEQIEQLMANLEQAEASVSLIEENINDCYIASLTTITLEFEY